MSNFQGYLKKVNSSSKYSEGFIEPSEMEMYKERNLGDHFTIGKQPCNNFTPEIMYIRNGFTHQCPRCGGERVFCENCAKDHHKYGWETCN